MRVKAILMPMHEHKYMHFKFYANNYTGQKIATL